MMLPRDQYSSLMNNSKWRSVFEALENLPVLSRIKWMGVEKPTIWGRHWIPADGYIEGVHPPERLHDVEWLEIECIIRTRRGQVIPDSAVDHTDEINLRLDARNIPHETDGSVIRITGYLPLS